MQGANFDLGIVAAEGDEREQRVEIKCGGTDYPKRTNEDFIRSPESDLSYSGNRRIKHNCVSAQRQSERVIVRPVHVGWI